MYNAESTGQHNFILDEDLYSTNPNNRKFAISPVYMRTKNSQL